MKRIAIVLALLLAVALGMQMVSSKENGMSETVDTELRAEIEARYSNAPEEIRAVARVIVTGGVPDAEQLRAIGPEALSQHYLTTDNQRVSLLNDTMVAAKPPNAAAAEALVAAGADVTYSDNLMVFNALRLRKPSRPVPFFDFSPGIPFLRLYLENGGDPNATFKRGNFGTTALERANNNLEGILLLLEHGADPWFQATGMVTDRLMDSFFVWLGSGTAHSVTAETFFRIAHAGHFKGATAEQLEPIFAFFERVISEDIGSRDPRDLLTVWQMQTIVDAIVETSGVTLPPGLATLMQERVPDQYGGWWMRPDQLHSGDEFVGPMITHGTLIWTHRDPNPRQRPAQ